MCSVQHATSKLELRAMVENTFTFPSIICDTLDNFSLQ